MMNAVKLPLRRVLNLTLWLAICFLGGTGALLYWRIPHGPEGHHLSVYGLSKHDLIEQHAIIGFIFIGLIIAHLWLAWPWLKNAAAKKKLWPILTGLLAGVILASGIAFAPLQTNAEPANALTRNSASHAKQNAGIHDGNGGGQGPKRWRRLSE